MFIVSAGTSRLAQSHQFDTGEAAIEKALTLVGRDVAHVAILDPHGNCIGPAEFSDLLKPREISAGRTLWAVKTPPGGGSICHVPEPLPLFPASLRTV